MASDVPPHLLVPPSRHSWIAQTEVPGQHPHGVWTPFTWEHDGRAQHGVVLTPNEVPWRPLFEELDRAGENLSAEPVTPLEEADAIVAACWRYGTFFHVLTFGESYPLFRSDRRLSRINDTEMMRVNVETSAALADWLATRASHPEGTRRRVRAAQAMLPMPWNRGRPSWKVEFVQDGAIRAAQRLESLVTGLSDTALTTSYHNRELDASARIRLQANTLVLNTYRNGPIEDLHAGMWSLGDQTPGFARLYAPDVTRVAKQMTERMAVELGMFDRLSPEATVRYTALRAPHDWTLTKETSFSTYRGIPGGPPLAARIKELAIRYPTAYGTTMREGSYDMYHDQFEPACSEPADVAVLLAAGAEVAGNAPLLPSAGLGAR